MNLYVGTLIQPSYTKGCCEHEPVVVVFLNFEGLCEYLCRYCFLIGVIVFYHTVFTAKACVKI